MKTSSQNKNNKSKKIWIPILIVLILVAIGGAGTLYWKQKTATTAATTTTSAVKTTQVRKGSITISVTGSGSLIAAQEIELAFSTSGTVAKVNVALGSTVKKGDVLAQLDNLTQLETSVNSAEQSLISAQKTLETLKNNGAANLANAQLTVVTDTKAVVDAKSALVEKGWVRCDQDTTDAYYNVYTKAKETLDQLGDGNGNKTYYQYVILPQMNAVAKAKSTYEYCAGYTDYEINSSQADLALAEAQATQAATTLSDLTKNGGVDSIELATAENNVATAQLALDKAKETLAGATITAPYDGTILTLAGTVGDTAGTSTFITIADMSKPQVDFSVDESDMDKVAVGETATVVFDALPTLTYTGKITRVNPALETSGGYQVLKGLISLDLSADTDASKLIKGLNGTVTIVQASAENVLLVPVLALHDLGDGTYSVFVVGSNGKPTMKVVEVGLQDAASAEIKSGLSLGNVVTTGNVQTK